MARITAYGRPLDEPGDYDEESLQIQRRRAQLDAMLLPQSRQSGLAGGLSNLLLGLTQGYHAGNLNDRENDLARRRDEYAQGKLEEYGRVQDTPAVAPTRAVNTGVPEPGEMGPAAPNMPSQLEPSGEGGAMIPTNNFGAYATPGSPMIPASMPERLKLLSQVAKGGPMYQMVAKHQMGQVMEEPGKREVRAENTARLNEDRALRIATEKRHVENMVMDNNRQQAALEAKISSDKTTAEERHRSNVELADVKRVGNELKREGIAAAAERHAEKRTETEKEVSDHQRRYGEALRKDKLPALEGKLADVEAVIKKYAGKQGGVPGVGGLYNMFPPGSPAAIEVRMAIQQLRNMVTSSEAGLSQTASEIANVMAGMGIKWTDPEMSFLTAIPKMRATLNTRKMTLGATYNQEGVARYHKLSRTPNPMDEGAAETDPELEADLKMYLKK